jgi:MFS family permease
MNNQKFLRSIFIVSIYGFAGNAFFPYINPYFRSLGISDSNISFIHAIAPIFIIFITPVMGRVADMVGRKRVVVWTSLFLAASVLGMLFLNIEFSLFSTAVFYTSYIVFSNVMEIVAISMSEDSIESKKRGYYTGIFQSIRSIFIVLGTLLGVYITSKYSIESIFFVSFILFVGLVFYALSLKKHLIKKRPKLSDFNFINDIKYFFRDARLRTVGLLGVLTNFSEGIFSVFVPLYIITELKAPVYFVGIVFAARYLVSISQFYFGKMCDIRGSGNMIFFGIMLKALALSLLPFSNSFSVLLLVSVLISIGGSIWNTSAWCYMSQIGEDKNEEGEIAGSYISIAHLGPFLSFIAGGFFVGYLGYRGLFSLAAFVCIISAYVAYKRLYNKPR